VHNECTVTHAVIDLGEAPAELPVPSRPVPYRALLGVLSAVLLALAGGATQQRAPVAPTVIPARLADTFTLDGDRMYLIEGQRITTYELPSMRVLARTAAPASGTVNTVQQVGGAMVVGYQFEADGTQDTAAYQVGGDRLLWRRPERFVATSAADGLALLSTARADVVVDLATGRERWRVTQPANGYIAEAGSGTGYPDWLVVLSGAGRLETYDAHTGRQVAAVSRSERTGVIWPVGSFLLVSADGGYDAYRLPGLRRLWHTGADLSQSWMQTDCAGVICTFRQQSGMTVLDPADGHVLWNSDRWEYAEPVGRYLLAASSALEGDVPSLWVLDPRTGKELGNFGAWRGLGRAPGGLFYGRREFGDRYQFLYGLLDPADRSVDVLGSADRVSNGCETGGGVLACRLVDASVAVWPLR
jgi:hypothetical protein